jgi:phospholipid/cholesterol/gamma-HCH transport system substrate-binding protein
VHGEQQMQSRAMREGSVGLMLIAGLGIFAAAALWLRGIGPSNQKYMINAQFTEAAGIQQGGAVRFRGIRVGKIANIKPSENGVEVMLEITDPTLKIPRNSIAEVSQTGLIGEPVIEIVPQGGSINLAANSPNAVDSNCDVSAIVCNNAVISGRAGASFNELLRRATALVNRYESPEIVDGLKKTLANASQAAADISVLSKKFGDLPESIKKELSTVSASANTVTKSLDTTIRNADTAIQKVGKATDTITITANKFGATAEKFGETADQVNKTANGINATAADYGKLAQSVDGLIAENRQTFKTTLVGFNALSVDLRKTVNSLDPTISKLNTTIAKIDSDALAKDLKGVLANANRTTENLRDVSNRLNNPKTLNELQETLTSARLTFQNVQKITADLDSVTGDPVFLNNIKKLVNGLGSLVSTGETMEQQIKLAQDLEPINQSLAANSAELARVYGTVPTLTFPPAKGSDKSPEKPVEKKTP